MDYSNISAQLVSDYFRLYVTFIYENNLIDDSDTITVKSLIEFVDEHILTEQ